MTFAGHPYIDGKKEKKILGIRVVHDLDEHSTDKLPGSYSREADSQYSIDREERGDQRSGQYRYFNPRLDVIGVSESDTDEDVSRYTEEAYKQGEAYHRGEWCYVGIRAEAEVTFTDVIQQISSGGIYGIESDSGDYLTEVANDELDALRVELCAAGFADEQIDAAIDRYRKIGSSSTCP